MKAFVLYILKLIMILVICSYALDICYTYTYENSLPRSKFQNLKAFKNQSIDYVFLGSSRVENGIDCNVIENKTDKKAFNFGFQASKMSDIYFILQLLDDYSISYKKVFIQVDYIFNIENGFSNVLSYEILPFINQNKLISNHCELNDRDNFWKNKNLPFYRYCIASQKIGFREVASNLVGKKTNVLSNKGYVPLYGEFSDEKYSLPNTIEVKNIHYNSIINYCNKNKKEIVLFIAPFKISNNDYSFVQKLETKIPDLQNFSNVLQNNKYFQNPSHLNNEGATAFTNIIIEKFKL